MKRKFTYGLGVVVMLVPATMAVPALGTMAAVDEQGCNQAVGTAVVNVTTDTPDCDAVAVVAISEDGSAPTQISANRMVIADANSDGKVMVRVMTRAGDGADENRGWLGVALGEIKESKSGASDEPVGAVRVMNVVEGSPAEAAGLMKDDIVTAVNGEAIDGVSDLAKRIGELGPDAVVDFTVDRDGATLTLTATLASAKKQTVKWLYDQDGDFDVHFFDQLHTTPQIIELSPQGQLRFLKEDDLKHLDSLPGAVADALSNMKFSTDIRIDGGACTLELKSVEDGTSIAIKQADDGPITVTRTDADGNESVMEYADADALADGDPDAFDLYNQAPTGKNKMMILRKGGDGDVTQWFDKDLQQRIRISIDQAMQRAAEAEGAADAAAQAIDKLPSDLPTWFQMHTKATHTFKVTPDGQIELTIRKGDTEVVRVFSDEADLQARDPDMYERYLDVADADLDQ